MVSFYVLFVEDATLHRLRQAVGSAMCPFWVRRRAPQPAEIA
jgi:hypothetical protein